MIALAAKVMSTAIILFFVAWAGSEISENENVVFTFSLLGLTSVVAVVLSMLVIIWSV